MGVSPESLPHGREGELIRRSGAVLTNARLSTENFGKIVAYYLSSTTNTTLSINPPVPLTLKQFEPRLLSYRPVEPMASLVELSKSGDSVFVGDGMANKLKLLSRDGKQIYEVSLSSTPVAMVQSSNGFYVTCIGSFSPSEQAKGSVMFVPEDRGKNPVTESRCDSRALRT